MGSGIARHMVSFGADVILLDKEQMQLDRVSNLFQGLSVSLTTNLDALIDREFVIEAVFEDVHIKRDVLKEISSRVSSNSIIATNTSSLLISDLSVSVAEQNRFIGVHYNNPPDFNPIVEIIPSTETTKPIVSSVHDWISSMDKRAIRCADTPCFVLNRQSLPYINEAVRCLDIATPAQIDAIAVNFLGVGLGPFAVMNLVGLPVLAAASRNLSVLGRGYLASLQLQQRSTDSEPNWVIEGPAECHPAVQLQVRDRLLGAMIYPGKDICEQNLCSRDDLHVICIEALGYGKSSVEQLESLEPREIDRLISIFLNGQK